MSAAYQALARRWRPQQFDDFVGQEPVVQALRHALDSGRLHHAFLFTGTRGVGKTTLARLLAKCVNCEQGVSSNPCGVCSACQEIRQGSFVDLLEIDAASRTRVDETREILDNVQYAPSAGRYKIYLIDEVHMLSTHSFNALLKTLEEPPDHVKFLLATTDPQKIPATILSRCLQFQLRRLEPERIRGRLAQILTQEQVPAEEAALRLLAKVADGSLRDALSLTDQAIVQGGGSVTQTGVEQMLGLSAAEVPWALLEGLLRADAPALFGRLEEQWALGQDPAMLLDGLIEALHQASLGQWLPTAGATVPAHLQDLLAGIPALTLQAWYYLLLSARRDFYLYPDARMAMEMALLRLLSFTQPDGPDPYPRHQQAVAAGPTDSSPGAAMASPKATNPAPSTFEPGNMPSSTAQQSASPPDQRLAELPLAAPEALTSKDQDFLMIEEPALEPAPPRLADWGQILERLSLPQTLREILRYTRAERCDGQCLSLAVEPAWQSLCEDARSQAQLREALTDYWGQTPELHFHTLEADGGQGSLAGEALRQKAAQLSAAEAALRADPLVQTCMEAFAATLIEVTPGSGSHRLH